MFKLLKVNIWLPFYIIALIASMLFASAIYVEHREILNETKSTQCDLSKTFLNRLETLFTNYESTQNLIAYEYINSPTFNIKRIKTLLDLDPLLLEIWIFTADGKLQLSSLPDRNVTNLLQNKNTRQWFQETLNTDKMVSGRPYLLTSINKWILPIRKRILNYSGQVVAVASIGIDLNQLHNQWHEESNHNQSIKVILKNGDFPIFNSAKKLQDHPDYYNQPYQPSYNDYNFGYNASYISSYRIHNYNATYNSNYGAHYLAESTLDRNNHEQFQADSIPEYLLPGIDYQKMKTLPLHVEKQNPFLYTLANSKRYGFFISAEIPYHYILKRLSASSFFYTAFYLLFIIGAFLLFRWIDKIEKSKAAALTYKAEHDALTGLANHTVINKHFAEMQKHRKTPFALLYLELDNYKNINKVFGHHNGRLILIEAAKRIAQSLTPCKKCSAEQKRTCHQLHRPCRLHFNSLVARYSGSEFVIFIESDNKKEIAQCAELLLKTLAQPYLINKNTFQVSASIGIACFPDDALEMESLLSYADSTMNRAQKRKNHYQFFSKNNHAQLTRNIEIEQALRRAIENKEISLVYQPQLDKKQKLFGVEALVRWHSKELGFVGPDEFISIAEQSGYMPQLGLYIMHKAMHEIAHLQKQTQTSFKLSINVSAKQFVQKNFTKKLLESCAFHGIDPALITIEITENLFIDSLERLLPIFNEVKAYQISLSLDDFGTGYSSLSMLRKVPIDELKVDKSFVDHITDNQIDREMVESIINMGKTLGIAVLAEGVETPAHVQILENAGCDLFQGYYFSKPLSLEQLRLFIKQQNSPSVNRSA